MHLAVQVSKKTAIALKSKSPSEIASLIAMQEFPDGKHDFVGEAKLIVSLNHQQKAILEEMSTLNNIRIGELVAVLCEAVANVNKSPERRYQLALQRQFGGQIEVVLPCGRIDLLTNDTIYEVKFAQCWKHSLGQVLAYAYYKPGYKKSLALIGRLGRQKEQVAEKVCSSYGVSILWIDR